MKKIFSLIVAIIILCASFTTVSASSPAEKANLRFNEDGTFKIMNISDIQDGTRLMSVTEDFISAAIEAEEPDLIILTGDNIEGKRARSSAKTEKAIGKFMDIFESYGVPVAIVFGNHDEESGVAKEEQMAVYNQYTCSVSYDDGDALWGCGTYNVPIYSSKDASKVAFNCWLFDSGNRDENGDYDHVKQDQIDWYKAKSAELKAANGGEVVPSIAFQHIIVPEIFDALEEADSSAEGAVPKYGKYYVLPETAAEGSILGEAPCPSGHNSGEFDAFVECGDVLAVVSGHDHTNSFVVPYKGINITNTPTCGFRSYGDNDSRGIRIFEIDEASPDTYETRIVSYFDLFEGQTFPMFKYRFFGFTSGTVNFFYQLWSKISSALGI